MIKSILESVFEKISSQKLKCTVYSQDWQKFGEDVGDALKQYNISQLIKLLFLFFLSLFLSIKPELTNLRPLIIRAIIFYHYKLYLHILHHKL